MQSGRSIRVICVAAVGQPAFLRSAKSAAMSRRFYVPDFAPNSTPELPGAEAHHVRDVLRKQSGDQLHIFDGRGLEGRAQIVSLTSETVRLVVQECWQAAGESTARQLTLATAVPKGDRFRWLVEKATELGVHRLIPLVAQRSIVDPGVGKLDKLRQTIVEASKQSGRSQLMQLDAPLDWKALIAREFAGRTVIIAHPGAEPLQEVASREESLILCIVGPEGGLTGAELESGLSAGAQLAGLGPTILRIETAAIAIASVICLPRM